MGVESCDNEYDQYENIEAPLHNAATLHTEAETLVSDDGKVDPTSTAVPILNGVVFVGSRSEYQMTDEHRINARLQF